MHGSRRTYVGSKPNKKKKMKLFNIWNTTYLE